MKTKSVVSILALLVTAAVASAQVILTGTNYVQTFDSLASGLPPGWSVRTNATATALGTVALFTTNTTYLGQYQRRICQLCVNCEQRHESFWR